jgi:hypothetical protein
MDAQLHYSENLLHTKWDGSEANKAARQRAAKDLMQYAAKLERFAAHKSGSKVAQICMKQAAYLERVAQKA